MKKVYKEHWLAILFFAVVTLFMTLPVMFNISSNVAGVGGDPWQTMWRFTVKSDAFSAAWREGTTLAFIAQEFLGQSQPQLVNVSVWPWMWLHWLFGQPTAYNVIWLLSFILSGYGMYWLVRMLIPDRQAPAFLAGLAYMFLPFHVAHAQGHFGAMQTQWLPLIFAAGIWWYRRPHWSKVVGVGVLLIIQAWTEHHYFLWLGIFTVIFCIFERKKVMAFFRLSKIRRHALILLGTFLLICLAYLPTIRLALQPANSLALGQEQTARFSADAFSYIIPAPFHSLWGNLIDTTFTASFTGNRAEATQFLGFTILLGILFFRQDIPVRPKKLWLIIGGVFYILSLGPSLHLLGNSTPMPLPYSVIGLLPVFSSIRTVARAGVFVGLAAVVLFAYVVRTQVRRPMTVIAVAGVLLLEFVFVPTATQSAQLSSFYKRIAAIPGTTMIEIPAATNYTEASRALYGSTIHGKEIIGNIALERAQSKDDFSIAKSYPALRQMLYLRTTDIREGRSEFFNQDLAETLPDVLRQQHVAAILIHKDSISALQLSTLRNFLEKKVGFTPTENQDEILYATLGSHTVTTDGIFLVRGDGWTQVERDVERLAVYATVAGSATVAIHNNNQASVSLALSFHYEPSLTTPLAVTANGQALDGIKDKDVYFFSFTAPPGVSSVTFTASAKKNVRIRDPKLVINELLLQSTP